ncbi:Nop52-domain-containing protein [Schizophyllum commune H4-8]|uniref:Nop52-domain-containing protein n=1 Tax=Schizophyllum commune (strain H4-8 / FGSC 9210) TaxID=578458 RepID=UPI00215FDC9D|nr:Nop52-domain-containing protein [Schizophyllum commune H4-8]KAI5898032.1 Nop52-domain-containing protein [Schizophyllum commune H4-8]
MATDTAAPPLAKYLASTEKKTRDKAVKNLAVFLSDPSRDALPKSEMDKLWKGLFYCFWMSDKPLVQQALASELAELVLTIKTTSAALAFLRGFWDAMCREWAGIDRLRLDKYYMLVRRFVNASFRLLLRNDWSEEVCSEYNEILTRPGGGPLCPSDQKIPSSLGYHVCDVYLEELEKAVASREDEIPSVPLAILISPFLNLASRTINSRTYARVESTVFKPLLSALSEDEEPRAKRARLETPSASTSDYPTLVDNSRVDYSSEGKLDRPSLRRGLKKTIFHAASAPETRDPSRKRMYALWQADEEDDE